MSDTPGGLVAQTHQELVDWIGRCVLPNESFVRRALQRASLRTAEIDDVVQEAYSRIAAVENFRQIKNPRAYFLKVARNIWFEQMRRSRLVRIDTVAEIDALNVTDGEPDQERTAVARNELARLLALIDALPARCRMIFKLRKIEGLSQKQIAERLGISENTVETQVGRGLRTIVRAWVEDSPEQSGRGFSVHEKTKRRPQRD